MFLVDGEYVRKNLDIDFTQGGHDKVYGFIPANEVWLDSDVRPSERPFILLHELAERNKMMRDVPYEEAHEAANELEKKARHNEKITGSLICEQYGGMNMPCCPEREVSMATRKQLEDKRAMEEASRLHKPTKEELEGGYKIEYHWREDLFPMSPEEGPPLPRALKIRWPWVK